MVFIGGAVISIYTDDPAADEIRPTQDIDMTLNVLNLKHWGDLQTILAGLGFYPDPYGHSVCRYKYEDIPVDIMSTKDGPLGPSNRWYSIGFESLWTTKVKEQQIKVLSAPCFLATKFEAFNDRGNDLRTSHDIEDIIYVLDNRINIVEEIITSDKRIKIFLIEQFNKIIAQGMMDEVLVAHIHPLMLEERLPLVKEKINEIRVG